MNSESDEPTVKLEGDQVIIQHTVREIYDYDEYVTMLSELTHNLETSKEIVAISEKNIEIFLKYKEEVSKRLEEIKALAKGEKKKFTVG